MTTTESYIKDFLSEEALKPILKESINKVKSMLKRLTCYLKENELEAHELGVKQAQGYQGRLKEENKNLGRNTIATLVIAAARFYEYLKKRKAVPTNPFSEIKRVRLDAGIPKNILSPKDANRLLEELSLFNQGQDFYERVRLYRLHVLAELLYSTGIRISEAAGLKVSDVDVELGIVQVLDRKSRKKRVCFLNEYTKGVMKLYLQKMRKWVFFESNYRNGKLFGAGGNRLGIALNEELKRACGKLKLTVITSHSFRHMVGSHLLKAGCDLRYIQELLGHERLRSTQVYTRVEKEDLRAVLDSCHPRQFKSKEHEQVRAV